MYGEGCTREAGCAPTSRRTTSSNSISPPALHSPETIAPLLAAGAPCRPPAPERYTSGSDTRVGAAAAAAAEILPPPRGLHSSFFQLTLSRF